MKKIHIVLLVLIAGTIAVLLSFLKTASTYETIADAKAKPGTFVHVAVRLDKTKPVEFDPKKDANYLAFEAVGVENPAERMKVVYRQGEIPNLMITERMILKGKYEGDHFECKDVQTKCPSKYKDGMNPGNQNIGTSPTTSAATNDSK